MSTSAQVPSGIVTGLHGRAQLIPAGEKVARALKEGDMIRPGDKVLTDKGTVLRITDENGVDWSPRDTQLAHVPPARGAASGAGTHHHAATHGSGKAALASKAAAAASTHTGKDNLEDVIGAVNRGDEDAATAAGLAGGGGAMGFGLRVDRVIEAVTPQEFTYSTPDRAGGEPFGITTPATATASSAAEAANRAPVITEPGSINYNPATGHYTLTTDEDKPLSGQVKATDPDGDPLSYVKGADPLHGTVIVRADGSWTYTPNKDYNGSDSFTVTVSDGKGGTTTATIDIGITPVNDLPKVEDPGNPNIDPTTGHYKVTTEEDHPVSGQVKATDADGDTLTFAKGSNPAHGTVTVGADGKWTYTPGQDFNGEDSFTVTVSDGHGGTTTATVDVKVTPVNDTPEVTKPDNGNFDPVTGHYFHTTGEDTPVSGKVTATDADGDALVYTRGANPAHGTVEVNPDGTWTYTPAKDFNGSDSFTVSVSDGHGGTTTATVDIGVTPANDAPKIEDPGNPNLDPSTGTYNLTTQEDKPLTGQVKASDVDGDALTFAKGSDPAHGTVTVDADGQWVYTPAKDFNGADSFTVTVSDGHGGTTTATVNIGVTPVNDAPDVLDPDNGDFDPVTGHYNHTTNEDTPVSGKVTATDADGDALVYTLGSNPAHGTVTVDADGKWTYTPAQDYTGADAFTVTVSDGHGGTTTAVVDIGVTPVNDAPKIDDPGSPNYDPVTNGYVVNTEEDKPVSGQVKATDADGDALTFAKGSDPAHGTVTVDADGKWTYTPAKDFNGSDSFTVTVSDGHGGTTTATIDIGVTPVNDAPKIEDPSNPNLDPSTGTYSLTTQEDKPLNGQVKASDADGDALTFAKGSDPAHGTVTVDADGKWTYTPAQDFTGSDAFTVTVSDGHGGTTTATINIGVTPANDAPKIEDPSNPNLDPSTGTYNLTTEEDKPLNGQVKASDADGDLLTFAKGSDPAHGTATVGADGTWTYTPAKDFNGADSFTVTVSDGHGGTTTATINIGVTPANDAPKIEDPSDPNLDPSTGTYNLTTQEDKPLNGQVKATDADGDALSFTKGSDPAHGTVTVNTDGTWTYTPAKDFNGADSFTVTVSDGHGGTTTATINIGVTPANDAPKIEDPSDPNLDPSTGTYNLTTEEDKPVSGQVKASDADGDALSFTKGSDPAHGAVTVNPDGTWTYTPAKDFNGADSFTVTVSDGHGGTTIATINIGVTPANDAPKIEDPGNPNLDPSTGTYILTTQEDKPLNGQVKATDSDGDTLSFSKGSGPAHGTVTVNTDGTWTYTPAKDFNGADSFTVTVSDGHGGTTTATIDIGVTPVNDAPKIEDPSDPNLDPSTGTYNLTTEEDKPVSGQVKASDADGDPLTFAKGSDPAHGTVTVGADGTWTYTPAKDFNGADSFTVTVSDGHGGTTTATINIGVTPANDAPKIEDPSNPNLDPSTGTYNLTTQEDKPLNGQVKASDADGDPLSFAKGSDPAHGTVTVGADGTWTYTPAQDFTGSDAFTVTVSDGQGGTTTATINIGVTPANDAPKIDDQGSPDYDPITNSYVVNTDEDKPVSGQVKATDADGDALTFTKGSDPTHGTVTVNTDGTWTYTPAQDFSGADSFTVTVSDGHGGTTTATINIGVTPANDAPKIEDPSNPNLDPSTGTYNLTTEEDKPVSGQVKASDADGDALSFTKGSDPAHGTVTVNPDGTWTYTPAKDFNGADSFTVTVSDGQGGTTTATINIGVTPVNDAPKIDDQGSPDYDPITNSYVVNTDEDKPVSGQVKATDADGDALTFTKGSDPAHGTVTVNADGTWTYTPAKDFNGSDAFTVTVSDGQGGTTTATINIGVTPANDAPKIEDPGNPNLDPSTGTYILTTQEDKPLNGQVKATDSDGDTLSFSKGSDPAHGTVTVNTDGTWTYTPAKDFNGADSFTVTVSDGQGGTTTATINIGVTPVNDAPKIDDPSDPNLDPSTGTYNLTTQEDKPLNGQVKASDADGDPLSFAKGSDPAHGTVTVDADGKWTYTPAQDFTGSDAFTVTVSDGHGGTTTATINIGVTPANDAPKIEDPSNPNLDPSTGTYNLTTEEDKPLNGQVKASDADGDLLTFAKGSDPAHGTATVGADGTWTYTPAKDFNGADSFTVTVSDGHGGTTTATIDIGVTPVNDAPKIEDPSDPNLDPSTGTYNLTTEEDKPVSGQVKASDADGDALSFTKGSDPAHGAVTVNPDGTWTYTPAQDFNGADSFTVTVSDGHGGTTTATINIGVTPVNDAPKIDDQGSPDYDPITNSYAVNTAEDKPVSGQVKATDADGDALTFTKGSGPAHGTVTVNVDGTWTYTPAKDFNGADSFTVTVSDGHGGTTTATIDIGVTPANDAPKIEDPSNPNLDPSTGTYSLTTQEDKPLNGQVKATDADGDALSFTKGSDPAHGTVTVNANGTWTYTPAKDFNGSDSFTVTVSDGHGGTSTATINIGVTPVNDGPKIDDPANPNLEPSTGIYKLTTQEDKPVSGQVKATDADGDALTFAKGSDPAHGTVTVNANGTWTYTPAKDFNGSDSFTVAVSDGHGGTTSATINIGVTPVNDAPLVSTPTAPSPLSEEGLAGGNADSQGSPDTGNSRETSGQITVSDADGDKLSFTLAGSPGVLTSGGVALTWAGNGTAASPLVGSAGGKPILTATIDDQGHYKITLQGPIDHPNTTAEDSRSVSLMVQASDGKTTSAAPLTFQIEDDSPLGGNQVMHLEGNSGTQNTNLMLIIDTSGSMKDTLADKTADGIKAAIKSLIDRYDGMGDVKIQFITFGDSAQGKAAWMTVDQAKTFVDALTANGGTNYDAALAAAKTAFATTGKLADGVNVSYFITDGQPSSGKGIDTGADETNWETFLKANHIDSYAVGTGSLTAKYIANIEPIAYDGIKGVEQGAATLGTNAELSKYLLDTVPTLKGGSLASLAGGDGLLKVESFTSSKQVSSVLDSGTKVLTITLQSGTEIKVNTLTGDFTMKLAKGDSDPSFSYTLVDKDGDRASGSLTLSSPVAADANHAPTALIGNNGANILNLVDLAANPLLDLAKTQHVAVNDVDNNLTRVDISVGQFLSLGTLLGDSSKLSLSLDASLTHGLHITGNDTRHLVIESDTPGHVLDISQVNHLLSTLSYDPAHALGVVALDLFPQLTIKATDAHGLTDSKSLSSSLLAVDVDAHAALALPSALANTVEHIVSGSGDHHGSNCTDVFAWTLADKAPQGSHHVDTISDFNCAARSAGGDVLDLRDLLHVDSHASAGQPVNVDKLLSFLDFDTQSQPGSTIIHVSASGGFQADGHGHTDTSACADQQHIVLSNVDIRSSMGLDHSANDHQVINELMNRGKLLVDNNGC